MSDRYYVVGVSGWSVSDASAASSSRGKSTSYSVLDRHRNHAEQARFYASKQLRGGDAHRQRLTHLECARLNHLDRQRPYAE